MNLKSLSALGAGLLLAACSQAPRTDSLTQYVDMRIGTGGHGHVFMGANVPFGAVQLGPTSIPQSWDWTSGYHISDTTVIGFSHTHLNGTGIGDLFDVTVMPVVGQVTYARGTEDDPQSGMWSYFSHANEKARPGYYATRLDRYGIDVELTATKRVGLHKYTFPASADAAVVFDLENGGCWDAPTETFIERADDHTISGYRYSTGWAKDQRVYFTAEFSKPFKSLAIYEGGEGGGLREGDSFRAERLYGRVGFDTSAGETIYVKVAISPVSIENARLNMQSELPGWDFEATAAAADKAWNAELQKVRVETADEAARRIFYTALYHTMIDPRIYTDADGRYPGADGRIHTTGGRFTKRTIFSGWDVFRSQMPLQTIINPQLVSDLVNSLVTMADESGRHYFERWEIVNAYSGCMLGNPALSVLADAYAKGIRSYDVEKAYRYAVNSSKRFGNDPLGYTPSELCISHTLEYAYTDWCISRLATQLGKREDAALYAAKGQAYRNIFDREKGWFRPRRADGGWEPWPGNARTTEWYGCIESNPYQQGWFVPHDVEGMVSLMGGREAVLRDLTEFFDKTPSDMLWNDYYNHANEPVHLVPFLFNRLGQPWQTQKWTRHICEKAYADKVEGIVGNEDAGQMSAWYVLAAAGLHPACPGDTRMEITSPVFDRIELRLDPAYAPGGTFTVVAHGNSPSNVYIQRAVLNGREHTASHIDFADIAAGGTLELYMGDTPNTRWGI